MDKPRGELEVTAEDRAEASRYATVIEWSAQDGVYVVTVPDIPNLHTHGATREDAATAADEGVALWIAGARDWRACAGPSLQRAACRLRRGAGAGLTPAVHTEGAPYGNSVRGSSLVPFMFTRKGAPWPSPTR